MARLSKACTLATLAMPVFFPGLALAARSETVSAENLSFRQTQLNGLNEALAFYRAVVSRGGWKALGSQFPLQRGDEGDDVIRLRKRLAISGELSKRAESAPIFDETLEHAVRHFQKRHGLVSNGIAGPETIQALNVPASERAAQIRETIARVNELPTDLGRRFVLVNIPERWLYVFDENRIVMKMRIVVGKHEHRTPTLTSKIEKLVINPAWVVPKSGLEQVFTGIHADPDYLDQRNIQVFKGWGAAEAEVDPRTIEWNQVSTMTFQYHLRQQPGLSNPLGRLEFVFENKFDIHLHDTPQKELFNENDRARSLGCVRVERALDLAEFVIHGTPKWNRMRIVQEMEQYSSRTVWLSDPVDIYIVYWPVWIDFQGILQFRDEKPAPEAAAPPPASPPRVP